MEEKNELVIKYINVVRDTFEKKGYPIPENIITMITNKYIDSPLSFEEIRKEINKLVEEKLEEIWRRMKSIDDIKQKIVNGISDLSVDTKKFIEEIQSETGVPVTIISTGPDLKDTIDLRNELL